MMPWIIAGTPDGWISRPARISAPNRIDGDDHAERVEPGQPGDDDRREAVARRDAVLQAVDHAATPPTCPASPASAARDAIITRMMLRRDVDAGVPGGARVVADQPDLVAPAGPRQHEPDQDRGSDQREDQAQVRRSGRRRSGTALAKSVSRGSQASRGNGAVCWKPPSLHGPKTQNLTHSDGDVVEHQRGDDLVDAEARP